MAWFDIFASDYDKWYFSKLGSLVDKIEKDLIEQSADFKRDENVLDIGAGTGNYSIWMAKKGLNVTGIDQSKEMLAIAKKKSQREKVNIGWLNTDAHSLDFASESFDLVISVTAIEFMDNPSKVLEEAYRVLKPNGRLVIGLLTKESLWGEMYQKAIEANSNNIFAKAHLYKENEIKSLLPYPYKLLKGLYIPPTPEFDEGVAWNIEMVSQKSNADNPGFYVVRWDKE